MTERTLDPELAPDATIRLYDHHRPGLEAGEYRVRVSQHVTASRTTRVADLDVTLDVVDYHAGSTDPTRFSVAGPRVSLPPTDVHSVFPPPTTPGRFSHVLPHVVLNRPTLPWERSGDEHTPADRLPWLALIVLDAAEAKAARVRRTTAAEAAPTLAGGGITLDDADDPAEVTTVLTLDRDVAERVLPDRDTLRLLAHVRTVDDHDPDPDADGAGAPRVAESAVVVANRFPTPGQHHAVHLVAVEDRYPRGATTPDLGDGDEVSLVSLWTWDLFCVDDLERSFTDQVTALAASTPHVLRLPTTDAVEREPAARAYVEAGFVPVTQRFRTGATAVSWYHGPLLPGPSPLPSTLRHGPADRLPVLSADQLLIRDADLDLLDSSYAAAWELGRLLIMARPKLARELHAWKVAHARHRHAVAAHDAHGDLPHGAPSPEPPSPDHLLGFFTEGLGHLEAVPFHYLVPDEAMLPPESLRFVTVDPIWVDCLIDGAFSIGRTTPAAHRRDGAPDDDGSRDLARRDLLPRATARSGVLIRSGAVRAFPGMLVDAYDAPPPDGHDRDAHLDVERLTHVRSARLAPDVLLVLFDGHVTTLDVHLHPQAMHFGAPEDALPTTHDRLVDLRSLTGIPDGTDLTPSNVGRAALDGVPLVRFVREGGA